MLCQDLELKFQLSNDEVNKTWPDKRSLSDFVRLYAKPLITDIVDEYFDAMKPPLDQLTEELKQSDVKTSSLVENLIRLIDLFAQSTKIGPDFIRLD